ncbi:MAG: hypothetical protein LWW83_05775 [Azonexaceae bacterium]|uniref:DUF6858 family protein n=1 Tax=Azonexus sp. R2A61 TaxID=2744443 RepID=UPI001F47CCD8|nr:hypothetical protein [Azonexus sp. R2A61]MCE1239415.1 hypothetical protein [Azonexaceae bacterium]
MKQTLLQEKYPIFVTELRKDETTRSSMAALIAYYQERIAENPRVQFIGVFDHHAHTTRIGGDIAPGILAAVDIIFCFGFAIPTPQMLAVRPRSIGIAEYAEKFVVSFMEAPMQPANQAMESWTLALRDR